MSDLQKYANKRIQSDPEFADNFFEGYESFKVGILLHQEREAAGMTQEDMARQLRMSHRQLLRSKTIQRKFDYL